MPKKEMILLSLLNPAPDDISALAGGAKSSPPTTARVCSWGTTSNERRQKSSKSKKILSKELDDSYVTRCDNSIERCDNMFAVLWQHFSVWRFNKKQKLSLFCSSSLRGHVLVLGRQPADFEQRIRSVDGWNRDSESDVLLFRLQRYDENFYLVKCQNYFVTCHLSSCCLWVTTL